MSLMQMLHPLNVKMAYFIQKNQLPAPARNRLLEHSIKAGCRYSIFFDDDVLFPDITVNRLVNQIRIRPEAALITGVVPTKIEPPEPLLYKNVGDGAYWDWVLGDVIPIHSAGAGCMIVDLEYVKKLEPPWFNDVVNRGEETDGTPIKDSWGHDRWFMKRLAEEAGGKILADTGLLMAHYDTSLNRSFVLHGNAPCYQIPPVGEAFVPTLTEEFIPYWTRLMPPLPDMEFNGYLKWAESKAIKKFQLIGEKT
jgi:hypothetical protein